MNKTFAHKFHIPVLGLGFSIDTPVKVAKYGISSVVSLVDDTLMEKLREHYLKKENKEYVPIASKEEDSRARRTTAYLNLLNDMVREQFEHLKRSSFAAGGEINRYFEMLPDFSILKEKYREMKRSADEAVRNRLQMWLKENMQCGSIDVNIMTKLDRQNFASNGEALPSEFNDAHSALRGFAMSEVSGSIIFSAGMNPKLFSYLETFTDFYPKKDGTFSKKIVIKVSDFRSAVIQGKFLAKKGLWVSEYRIESGLNCGGHAFATDGLLLGPILEDFKTKRGELFAQTRELFLDALKKKSIEFDQESLSFDVTVQGGVGTSEEQEFLLRHYEVKSVGWGSPFLLVPEVMNVDDETLKKLSTAGEKELYLSGISPLGVMFNNMQGNSKDIEKEERAENKRPGFPCTKKFLALNREFSDKPMCTASITYINKKLKELGEKFSGGEEVQNNDALKENKQREYDKIVEKACLCEGLAASALIVNGLEDKKASSAAVSVCPGPNLAYFSKVATLREMVDHIYGKINLITASYRPNMFVKELSIYVDYLRNKIEESRKNCSSQSEAFLKTFRENMLSGIAYYRSLLPEMKEESEKVREKISEELDRFEQQLISFALA